MKGANMRRILNSNLSRQLKVFEYLSDYHQQTIHDLRSAMKVDEKTIKTDVQVINSLIAPVQIEVKGIHYQIKVAEKYDVNYVYAKFLEASLEFNVLEKILLTETFTYNELAEELFISVSTLRRLLTRLKQILYSYDMVILTNPLRVRGNEGKILNFIFNYLKERYLITSNFLNDFESELIDEMLASGLAKLNKDWTFTQSESLKWLIKTHLIRMSHGNHRDYQFQEDKEITNRLLENLNSYQGRFKRIFGRPFTLEMVGELVQESYVLSPEQFVKMEQNNNQIAKKIAVIKEILGLIEVEFEVASENKGRLVLQLYNMMTLDYSKGFILYDMTKEFNQGLKNKKPDFYRRLKAYYEKNKTIFDDHSFSQFVFLIVTEWEELFEKLNQKKRRMKIGLFFSTTENHIQFIEEKFKKALNNHYFLISLNNVSLQMLDKTEVDLIVTNISDLSTKKQSICVSDYPKEGDYQKVTAAYRQWSKQ